MNAHRESNEEGNGRLEDLSAGISSSSSSRESTSCGHWGGDEKEGKKKRALRRHQNEGDKGRKRVYRPRISPPQNLIFAFTFVKDGKLCGGRRGVEKKVDTVKKRKGGKRGKGTFA